MSTVKQTKSASLYPPFHDASTTAALSCNCVHLQTSVHHSHSKKKGLQACLGWSRRLSWCRQLLALARGDAYWICRLGHSQKIPKEIPPMRTVDSSWRVLRGKHCLFIMRSSMTDTSTNTALWRSCNHICTQTRNQVDNQENRSRHRCGFRRIPCPRIRQIPRNIGQWAALQSGLMRASGARIETGQHHCRPGPQSNASHHTRHGHWRRVPEIVAIQLSVIHFSI